MFAMYDMCHLIKSLRNMHMNYDFSTPDGITSFGIIRSMYSLDTAGSSTRLCPKLSEKHIYPNSFEKMRVKFATQVYSTTCAAAIRTMADLNAFGDRTEIAIATSTFLMKIDRMFDCLNCKRLFDRNPYKCSLQKNNEVKFYLESMLDYFKIVEDDLEDRELIELIPNKEMDITAIDLNSMRYICGYILYKFLKKKK